MGTGASITAVGTAGIGTVSVPSSGFNGSLTAAAGPITPSKFIWRNDLGQASAHNLRVRVNSSADEVALDANEDRPKVEAG